MGGRKDMKKKILVIFVCMLLITTIGVIPTSSTNIVSTNEKENSVSVRKLDVPGRGFCVEGQKIENAFSSVVSPLGTDIQVTSSEYDEIHPTIATDSAGNYLIAYEGTEDGVEKEIYASVSTDYGETWIEMGNFVLDGTDESYPSFDYDNDMFYGTFAPDPTDDQGGIQYVVIIPDVTNPNTWELWWWVWGTWYNCTDRESPEIACDYYEGINPWEYGVIAFVHTGIDDGTYKCPVMNYADDANEGYGWYYFWYLDDCANSACEIDRTTDFVYAAYDWYDTGSGVRDIVYMKDDFTNMWPDGPGAILYEIDSSANNINPTVAADNDNIMIICQTDEAGNQDIICYYSSNGGSDWDASKVVGTGVNEMYPDAVSLGGLDARCTFIKNGDIYYTDTDDGGVTWSSPVKVNDVDGDVVMEYRAAEVCEQGTTWMDNRNGNDDIYFDLLNNPPEAPNINGPTSGSAGTEYPYTLNADDPDGHDVRYHVDWGDENSEITDYNPSGTDVVVKHTWADQGTFTIKVKAEDALGSIGPENTLVVTMPRAKNIATISSRVPIGD